MSSTDYQIPAFTHRIADLPDQPNLSPSELKARFDACPEELRVAHNALAKCVSGITDATYPDTVTESMLAEAVREKIDGKAEQAALESEVSAREAACEVLTNTVSEKPSLFVSSYDGNGSSARNIGFAPTPRAVIIMPNNGYPAVMVVKNKVTTYGSEDVAAIDTNVLRLLNGSRVNASGVKYHYIAFY